MPTPAVPAHTPIARPRSCGGKTLVMIDSVAGMISAPPMPMNARVAISWSAEPANAEASEPRPKSTYPACSAPRRPYRSPSAPMVSSRPANTSVYESTIHCTWLFDASRSRISVGMATLRIELSRTMTSRLTQRTTRIAQRRW